MWNVRFCNCLWDFDFDHRFRSIQKTPRKECPGFANLKVGSMLSISRSVISGWGRPIDRSPERMRSYKAVVSGEGIVPNWSSNRRVNSRYWRTASTRRPDSGGSLALGFPCHPPSSHFSSSTDSLISSAFTLSSTSSGVQQAIKA